MEFFTKTVNILYIWQASEYVYPGNNAILISAFEKKNKQKKPVYFGIHRCQ